MATETSTGIKTGIVKGLVSAGFQRGLGGAFVESDDTLLIISPNVSPKSGQFSLSGGLWIKCLSQDRPASYNKCHIYGSAGSLMPDLASVVDRIQPNIGVYDVNAADETARVLPGSSQSLLTLEGVRDAFRQGHFSRCLILKEARALLAGADPEDQSRSSEPAG